MGRFKNDNIINPISVWLSQKDFKNETGARGEKGLTKTYSVDDGYYYVWVTINLGKQKIYIYKEYDCGGMVGEDEIDIQDEWLKDLDIFIDEVDNVLERWIG